MKGINVTSQEAKKTRAKWPSAFYAKKVSVKENSKRILSSLVELAAE